MVGAGGRGGRRRGRRRRLVVVVREAVRRRLRRDVAESGDGDGGGRDGVGSISGRVALLHEKKE